MTTDTSHKAGCDALGGYGHGVGVCSCGVDTQLAPTDAELDEILDSPGNINWVIADRRERWRLFARAVLARWGQPAHSGEPVATVGSWTNGSYSRNYKITWHRDVPEGTKLYTAPQPVEREPLTEKQIEAAAKKLSECMDYPWESMPKSGRAEMRKHAQSVIAAAHGIKGGQHADT